MPPEAKSKGKHGPTALLIHLQQDEAELLKGVFRQFSIETETTSGDVAKMVNKRKFEACVLRLDDAAEETLQTLRQSARNRSLAILGICSPAPQAMRFS